MNDQRTRLLQQFIDEEQRKLEEAMKVFIVPRCADDNDMASCYESTNANLILIQHAGKRLKQLASMANLAAAGGQALCQDCGEEISARRLAAVPDAVRCAACQEEWEEESTRSHALPHVASRPLPYSLPHQLENTAGSFAGYAEA